MEVELLFNTPLWVCAKAIRKCWASEGKSDSKPLDEMDYYETMVCGEADKALIDRVGKMF